MNFKIHRGTKEIGGSCVEVWTENTRILLDFGMPLVEKDGTVFDFGIYKAFSQPSSVIHTDIYTELYTDIYTDI